MRPADRQRPLLAVNPTCAVCDRQVTVIQGAPARRTVSRTSMRDKAFTWCKLLPCGHVFRVHAGGLIH
jgi:hypothetical protein